MPICRCGRGRSPKGWPCFRARFRAHDPRPAPYPSPLYLFSSQDRWLDSVIKAGPGRDRPPPAPALASSPRPPPPFGIVIPPPKVGSPLAPTSAAARAKLLLRVNFVGQKRLSDDLWSKSRPRCQIVSDGVGQKKNTGSLSILTHLLGRMRRGSCDVTLGENGGLVIVRNIIPRNHVLSTHFLVTFFERRLGA